MLLRSLANGFIIISAKLARNNKLAEFENLFLNFFEQLTNILIIYNFSLRDYYAAAKGASNEYSEIRQQGKPLLRQHHELNP